MQTKKRLLGEMLRDTGMISDEQLQEALKVQKQTGERLGKVLVNLGFVSEQTIIEVLEFQLGIPQVSLYKQNLDADTVKILPEPLIRRHKILPIARKGNKLTVGMVDPLNLVAIEDAKIISGLEIEPVIVTEREIDAATRRFFGHESMGTAAFKELENPAALAWTETFNLDHVEPGSDEAPVVRAVNAIIQQAIKDRVSDIHIEPHEERVRVRYRQDGLLRDVMNLPKTSHASLCSRIKIMAKMDIAEKRVPQDGRIQITSEKRSVDLRVSSIPTIFGEKIAIRILDKTNLLIRLDQLGFQPQVLKRFQSAIRQAYGMILITGPTGSGKTTTLYAVLNELNNQEKNIITVEDPVEYVLAGVNQIQVNPKAGLTFASGLRSILRQDPDTIMVGEIRDGETADIAVRAATTGHLVLTTLHTNDAAGAVTRLIDMGIEPFLVASSVICIVAQRLVRLICPNCREQYPLPEGTPERLFLGVAEAEPVALYRGRGCGQCNNTGYRGRAAIQEFMVLSHAQRELILAKEPSEALRHVAVREGMVTLREDGIQKALSGLTTIQEVMRVANVDEN